MTLCALQGFEEFMQANILEAALALQQESGCYGSVANKLRAKRESNLIDGSCVDHTTGLGASTLALLLKYNSQLM